MFIEGADADILRRQLAEVVGQVVGMGGDAGHDGFDVYEGDAVGRGAERLGTIIGGKVVGSGVVGVDGDGVFLRRKDAVVRSRSPSDVWRIGACDKGVVRRVETGVVGLDAYRVVRHHAEVLHPYGVAETVGRESSVGIDARGGKGSGVEVEGVALADGVAVAFFGVAYLTEVEHHNGVAAVSGDVAERVIACLGVDITVIIYHIARTDSVVHIYLEGGKHHQVERHHAVASVCGEQRGSIVSRLVYQRVGKGVDGALTDGVVEGGLGRRKCVHQQGDHAVGTVAVGKRVA